MKRNFFTYIGLFVIITALSVIYLTREEPAAEGRGVSVIPKTIRIGIVREAEKLQFAVQGKYRLLNGYNGEMIALAEPNRRYTVEMIDRGGEPLIKLSCDGRQIGVYSGPLVVQKINREASILSGSGALAKRTGGRGLTVIDASGEITPLPEDMSKYTLLSAGGLSSLRVNDELQLVTLYTGDKAGRYRGDFDFRLGEKGITAINDLPFEEYLYGVVPSEMPHKWPEEALKAQAVVARTYALYSRGQYLAYGFDILANQYNQVYHGYDHETPETTMAVQQTRGQVLTYEGRLILAVFHSSSGGYTGNCAEVWKEDIPYLKAKKDPYDYNEKHYNWSVNLTAEQLAERFTAKGYPYTKVLDIEEVQRDKVGARVKVMRVKGIDREGKIKEEEIYNADRVRYLLGLKSSIFTMDKQYDQDKNLRSVTFTGSGWGHGLGMSQYGARAMALEGYSYQDILQYYYSGVNLEYNYGV
ncbi:stage II sporulation protein D [Desulfohalotomaculum tongense]|uniref:SpoIID/LytB domain-containing protein n=1 Tax=Desulforadius tongensis TaxID=1216062 RepID=UPI0019575500|nr:SpoIID/LytB domain-containing protein [Desulforadius tongensis]MBM7855119.1 stage II sporulation protein D [Desulforadius tongensis]